MSTKKTTNNTRRTTRTKLKKRKINKKRLVFLICIIGIFIFGINRATLGVSKVAQNIDNMKKQEVEKQKAIDAQKQYDLQNEKKDGLNKKYTIAIDPGHGGKDKGNLGTYTVGEDSKKTVYEKDLDLQIGKKVAGILSKQNDIQVVLTRSDDESVSVEDRVKMINSQNPYVDAFVSIHMNAQLGDDSAYGTETYYRMENNSGDKSLELAKSVQNSIASYIPIRDRGVKQQVLEVLRDTRVPAVLVECGFISNPKEQQKLIDEKYQDKLAEGIAQGVLSFLDQHAKR